MPQTQYLHILITKDQQNPVVGILPSNVWVQRVSMDVTEAFDGGGAKTISVGYDGDVDAYAVAVDVSSVGIKTLTLGSGVGFDPTARQDVDATYSGSSPTTGKAHAVIEYFLLPPE